MAKWKRGKPMPNHTQTEDERNAYLFCVNEGIKVSPGGVTTDEWTIDVNPNGECWYKSPKSYGRDEVWDAYYNVCQYYYKKRNE